MKRNRDIEKLLLASQREIEDIPEVTELKEFSGNIEDVINIETLANYLNVSRESLFIYPEYTTVKHEQYINACNILPKIAKVYNEGTILNWKNSDEYKYLPYLNINGGSFVVDFDVWSVDLLCPAAFYFKNNELSKKAYNNFSSFYINFWGITPD